MTETADPVRWQELSWEQIAQTRPSGILEQAIIEFEADPPGKAEFGED